MSDYISQTITVSSCQSDISNQCRTKINGGGGRGIVPWCRVIPSPTTPRGIDSEKTLRKTRGLQSLGGADVCSLVIRCCFVMAAWNIQTLNLILNWKR